MKNNIMKMGGFVLPLTLVMSYAPLSTAQNIADCEVLIAERIEDEATGGSALISSYRPAGAFLSSVYDDEDGHITEIDGHKIRAVFCQRRSAVPSLRDYPIVETGIALSLSQNFDSALSDVVLVRFKDDAFRAEYTGPGLSEAVQAEMDDVIEVFNLQPHKLAVRRKTEAVKVSAALDVEDEVEAEIESLAEVIDTADVTREVVEIDSDVDGSFDNSAIEIITLAPSKASDTVSDTAPITEDIKVQDLPLETVLGVAALDVDSIEAAPEDTNLVIETDVEVAGAKSANVPLEAEAAALESTCKIIARDGLGVLQNVPISASGLQSHLAALPNFVFPVPAGLSLRALECERDTLIPGANDYKVARAGYPFIYKTVDSLGLNNRMAALEFVGGKFRMNLTKGDFTTEELVSAKARILSFNNQYLRDIIGRKKDKK